jgi:lipid-A-disaccharide synthase
MHRYSLALCASGTACLEAALAGVPPVIGYRCDPFSAFLARQFLLTDRIGLPNILLGEDAFPEILQGNLRPDRIVDGLTSLHGNPEAQSACGRLRTLFEMDDGQTFGSRMARLLVKVVEGANRAPQSGPT